MPDGTAFRQSVNKLEMKVFVFVFFVKVSRNLFITGTARIFDE
jgi:hypothetical protein